MGDGDAVTIGGNHFIHAARRNIDVTAIIANNYNYGMTGGQYSATTPEAGLTSTSPRGTAEPGFDICKLAEAAGANYVARTTVYHVVGLKKAIRDAITVKGFSLVEVVSPCPTYYGRFNIDPNPATLLKHLKDHAVPLKRFLSMPPSEQERHFPIGTFISHGRPDFYASYQKMNPHDGEGAQDA